jgi:glycerophosphoryl diester phosphodiesterase
MTQANISVIAHRGGREWAPENTMRAFANCLELGVDGIELDVQRCASGELVVIHDADLTRTTNGGGFVAEATLEEIKRLSAGLWFDKEFYSEKVPLLSEVLALVGGQCLLNIEVKNAPISYPGIEEELLALLSGYSAPAKIIISSFDHYVLLRLGQLLPEASEIQLALLADAVLIDLPAYASRLKTSFFHPCFGSLRQDIVDDAHKCGMKVNAWTLNNRSHWAMAGKMGVDGVVTDDPEELMIFWARAIPAGAVSLIEPQS